MSLKSLGNGFQIFFFFSFLVWGLLVNGVQWGMYLVLPSRSFHILNYYLQYTVYAQFLFTAEWWSGSKFRIFGDKNEVRSLEEYFGKEHALILCNHHYEIDWLFGWMIADRCGVLGATKVFMKDVLKYVPILGWGWYLSDIIFVRRDWNKDRHIVPKTLSRLQDYPFPCWLLIFAEGTRFTPEKYEASQIFRSKSSDSLPHLKHHLIPRSKGFVLTLKHVDPSKVPAIYDVTLVTNKETATISNVFNGREVTGDLYIRRISLKHVLDNQEESPVEFLMKTYEEKDNLVDHYKRYGNFGENASEIEIPSRRIYSLLIFILINTLILIPTFTWLFAMILYGTWIQASGVIGVLFGLQHGLKKMIAITEVSEGSGYGGQKKET